MVILLHLVMRTMAKSTCVESSTIRANIYLLHAVWLFILDHILYHA